MISLLSILALYLVAFLTHVIAQSVGSSECATGVHAIFARGQGEGDDYDVLKPLSDLVLETIPGSTSIGLPYAHADYNLIGAMVDGASLVIDYVEQYIDACPNSRLLLVGYSMGAVPVLDAICGASSPLLGSSQPLGSQYAQNIIAVVAFGDLTHIPGMAGNTGTCPNGVGVLPRLKPRSCQAFAASIRNYCDQGDKFCCSVLSPGDNMVHAEYFGKYTTDMLSFVNERIAETAESA